MWWRDECRGRRKGGTGGEYEDGEAGAKQMKRQMRKSMKRKRQSYEVGAEGGNGRRCCERRWTQWNETKQRWRRRTTGWQEQQSTTTTMTLARGCCWCLPSQPQPRQRQPLPFSPPLSPHPAASAPHSAAHPAASALLPTEAHPPTLTCPLTPPWWRARYLTSTMTIAYRGRWGPCQRCCVMWRTGGRLCHLSCCCLARSCLMG